MIRLVLAFFISFSILASPAQALLCQDVWRVSNNLSPAERLYDDLNRVAQDPHLLHPQEAKLDKYQRALLRKIFLQIFIVGMKKIFDPRRFWSAREFKDITQAPATKLEQNIQEFLATMVEKNQLMPYLQRLLDWALRMPYLGAKLKEREHEIREKGLLGGLDTARALVEMRGMTSRSKHFKFTPWEVLSEKARERVGRSSVYLKSPLKESLSDPLYMQELLELGKSHFVKATHARLLVDGPQSYALREKLISEAKESIDLMVWGFEDDFTGADVAARLAQKVREGVKVRVMVDGKISRYLGYRQKVAEMESLGIEVIRWYHRDIPYLIQHRKLLVVDGKSYIAGGLNVGDSYSHKNPDPLTPRWRDTDIFVEGPAAVEGQRLFARLWNEQIDWHPQAYGKYQKIEMREPPEVEAVTSQSLKIALFDSTPSPFSEAGTPLMHVLLKAIRGAEKSIDIENAYLVMTPALVAEIQAAVQRGVRVRVLTNSNSSVDQAVVTKPILRTARVLSAIGAEVYLKKGDMLHSKVMIVDGRFSFVKSYNLHPRSERSDAEIAVLVDDVKYGKEMTQMFETDISMEKALKVDRSEDVKFHEGLFDSLLLNLVMRLGYDAL